MPRTIPTDDERQFVQAARGLVGTPFRHQGRVPGVGVDCIGVIIVAAKQVGWLPATFDVTGYAREPTHGLLEKEMEKYLEVDSWGPIALMRLLQEPQHVGVLDWDRATLIHAWQFNKQVVEHRLDTHWMNRIYRSYRWQR